MKLTTITLTVTFPLAVLAAQRRSDADRVEVAAARHTLAGLPPGVVALDVTPLPGPAAHVARTRGQIKALIAAIRAKRSGPTQNFFSCAGRTPSSCSVRGADMVISFSRPTINGAEAIIDVRILAPTGMSRLPVVRSQSRLLLARDKGDWTVKRVVDRSTT
jgi:hypothetical protein